MHISQNITIPMLLVFALLLAACQPIQPPTPAPMSETQVPTPVATSELVSPTDPIAAEEARQQGMGHLQEGDYDQAVTSFMEAVRLDPNNADAHFLLGYALANVDRLDDAILSFTEAIQVDPEHIDAYQYRGASKFLQGHYAAAVEDCAGALRVSHPYLLPVQVCLNVMSMLASSDLDDPAAAIKDYDEAIRLNPEFAAYYLFRGLAYRVHGDIESAITDIDRAVALDPRAVSSFQIYSRRQQELRDSVEFFSDMTLINAESVRNCDVVGLNFPARDPHSAILCEVPSGVRNLKQP